MPLCAVASCSIPLRYSHEYAISFHRFTIDDNLKISGKMPANDPKDFR